MKPGLDHREDGILVGRRRQTEPHQDTITVLFYEVKVTSNRGVLGQDSHRPARFPQEGFQAATSQVVFLGCGAPSIDRCTQLNQGPLAFAFAFCSELLGKIGINNGIPVVEGVFAHVSEGFMVAQNSPAAAVRAVMSALQANVHGEIGQSFLGKLRRWVKSLFQRVTIGADGEIHGVAP